MTGALLGPDTLERQFTVKIAQEFEWCLSGTCACHAQQLIGIAPQVHGLISRRVSQSVVDIFRLPVPSAWHQSFSAFRRCPWHTSFAPSARHRRPSHQMRPDNFHKPLTRVDDAKIPVKGQAKALRCNGDTTTPLPTFQDLGLRQWKEKQTSNNAKEHAEDDCTDEEIVTKGDAAVHAANVDDDATDEPHDPDNEPEEVLLDPKDQRENSHDVDSNPSFSSVPQDDEATEDEPEPWVEYMVCASVQPTRRMIRRQQTGSNHASSGIAEHLLNRPE